MDKLLTIEELIDIIILKEKIINLNLGFKLEIREIFYLYKKYWNLVKDGDLNTIKEINDDILKKDCILAKKNSTKIR
jgi:hypothetical protein